MQIAIDGVPAAKPNKTGVEWYVYHLIKQMNELQPELDVAVYTHRPLDFKLKGNWRNIVVNWPLPGWKWIWSLHLWLTKPAVVFSPGDSLPPYIPNKSLQTKHDIGFHWMPEEYSRKRLRVLEREHKRSARVATKMVAITQVTKDDIVKVYGVNPERITITPLAVDHDAYKPMSADAISAAQSEYDLPKNYFVCIGRLDQRKGQADLMRAFLSWRGDKDIDLVLIGRPGRDGYDEIQELAQDPHIHELGWLGPDDAAAIVAGAKAFTFATKKEGFGIPILEAMAVATPVICSDLPVLREVGGDVPIYVDRADESAWHKAFDRVLEEDVDERVARGIDHASHYTWEHTARETLRVLCNTL